MEENNTKINFFTRLKYSVFKLEDYGIFLGERLSVSIKYFFLLILLISVLVSATQTYLFSKMVSKGYLYFVNEIPDFEYKDEVLTFPNKIEAYDDEYGFYLFVNTDENISEDQIKEYKNKIYDTSNGIVVLRNKLLYVTNGGEIEYEYKELLKSYNIDTFNKQAVLDEYNKYGNQSIISVYFIVLLLSMYISNLITIALDIVVLTLFGMIAARMCGIRISFAPMLKISIHAITLSVLITGIYTVVHLLTGFVISYYNVMYLLISYVYVVAAIMMLKTDLLKQAQELSKIEEVRKEVKKELEDENDDDKEKEDNEQKEDDKKEKDKGKEEEKEEEKEEPDIKEEPDGSEI